MSSAAAVIACRVYQDECATAADAVRRFRTAITATMRTYLSRRGLGEPAAILDVGCSTGIGTRWLAEEFPGAQLTAIDASPYFLAVAKLEQRCVCSTCFQGVCVPVGPWSWGCHRFSIQFHLCTHPTPPHPDPPHPTHQQNEQAQPPPRRPHHPLRPRPRGVDPLPPRLLRPRRHPVRRPRVPPVCHTGLHRGGKARAAAGRRAGVCGQQPAQREAAGDAAGDVHADEELGWVEAWLGGFEFGFWSRWFGLGDERHGAAAGSLCLVCAFHTRPASQSCDPALMINHHRPKRPQSSRTHAPTHGTTTEPWSDEFYSLNLEGAMRDAGFGSLWTAPVNTSHAAFCAQLPA